MQIYHYILDFLTGNPTPEQIAAFRPTSEMVERLQDLLLKHKSGNLTHSEQSELDEYERIEHLIIMLKSGKIETQTELSPNNAHVHLSHHPHPKFAINLADWWTDGYQ